MSGVEIQLLAETHVSLCFAAASEEVHEDIWKKSIQGGSSRASMWFDMENGVEKRCRSN